MKNGYVFNNEAHVEVLVVWEHSITAHPKLRGPAHRDDMLQKQHGPQWVFRPSLIKSIEKYL